VQNNQTVTSRDKLAEFDKFPRQS